MPTLALLLRHVSHAAVTALGLPASLRVDIGGSSGLSKPYGRRGRNSRVRLLLALLLLARLLLARLLLALALVPSCCDIVTYYTP